MFKRWNKLTLAVLAVFIGCWCEAAQAEVCLLADQDKCEDAVMPDISKEAGKDVCRGIKEHREGSAWECKKCNGAEWCYCPTNMEIVDKDCVYTPHNDKCGQIYQFTSNLKETKKNPEYDSLWECKLCDDKNSRYDGMYKCDCPAVFDIIDYSCEKERCGTDYSYTGGCPGRGYEEDQCAQRASLWFKKWKCYCNPSTKRITKKKDCVLKCAEGEYEEESDCEKNTGEGEDCQQNSVTECYYIHDNCPGYDDTAPKSSSSWDCSNAQCQSYARYDNSKCTAKNCPSGEYTYSECQKKVDSTHKCTATSNYSGDNQCYELESTCNSSSSNWCAVHQTCHGDCCTDGTIQSCDPQCGGSGCNTCGTCTVDGQCVSSGTNKGFGEACCCSSECGSSSEFKLYCYGGHCYECGTKSDCSGYGRQSCHYGECTTTYYPEEDSYNAGSEWTCSTSGGGGGSGGGSSSNVDTCEGYTYSSRHCDSRGNDCCDYCSDSSSSNYGKYKCSCSGSCNNQQVEEKCPTGYIEGTKSGDGYETTTSSPNGTKNCYKTKSCPSGYLPYGAITSCSTGTLTCDGGKTGDNNCCHCVNTQTCATGYSTNTTSCSNSSYKSCSGSANGKACCKCVDRCAGNNCGGWRATNPGNGYICCPAYGTGYCCHH